MRTGPSLLAWLVTPSLQKVHIVIGFMTDPLRKNFLGSSAVASMSRQVGIEELTVVWPGGRTVIVP